MSISKQIVPGSVSVSMFLTETLPLDFPAFVEASYVISSIDEPLFMKNGSLRITILGTNTVEEMWEAVEAAINIQEGII